MFTLYAVSYNENWGVAHIYNMFPPLSALSLTLPLVRTRNQVLTKVGCAANSKRCLHFASIKILKSCNGFASPPHIPLHLITPFSIIKGAEVALQYP